MRDPRRIRRILGELAALWSSSPDLRLGQLILNAAKVEHFKGRSNNDMLAEQNQDIYNVEDEELIRRICTYMKKC